MQGAPSRLRHLDATPQAAAALAGRNAAGDYNRPMDEIVLRALQKWPNVPSVYGWLALDRRGNWSIKGERLANPAFIDFIGRNYEHDEHGRWFFQNGPQRVFVTLAYTPLVFRTRNADGGLLLADHRGEPAPTANHAWLDETGAILIEAESGVGVVHDQDLPELIGCLTGPDRTALSDAAIDRFLASTDTFTEVSVLLGGHLVPISRIQTDAVPARFGFDPAPRPATGEPEC